tara:strand:+ start:1480 stop:2121 length:642 start_codon:yes stop_codon:yes gene_type:complete
LSKKYLLSLHSSTELLGVGLMDLSDSSKRIKNKVFETGRELSNNVFKCINDVLPFQNWNQISRLSVAIGPGGFTGTRIAVAISRTIAQQLNCELDGVSCFALMAKRLDSKNEINNPNEPFWIIKSLKRQGIIGGLYKIQNKPSIAYCEKVIEIEPPHLLKGKMNLGKAIKYEEDVYLDISELLHISLSAHQINKKSRWNEILPIYPTSPIDNI